METIPDHKDFDKASPQYRSLRKAREVALTALHYPSISNARPLLTEFSLQTLVQSYMQELEALKLSLKLKIGTDSSSWVKQPSSHTPDTVKISTSDLSQLDWEHLARPPPPSAALQSPASGAAGMAGPCEENSPQTIFTASNGKPPGSLQGRVTGHTLICDYYALRAFALSNSESPCMPPDQALLNYQPSGTTCGLQARHLGIDMHCFPRHLPAV